MAFNGAIGGSRPQEPFEPKSESSRIDIPRAKQRLDQDSALLEALIKRGKSGVGKIRMSDRETELLADHVIRDIQDGFSSLSRYKDNMVEMLKNWRSSTDPKNFPFPNCANVRVPFTSVHVEQMAVRIVKAILGNELYAMIESMDSIIPAEKLDEANQWFHWELQEIVEFKAKFKEFIKEMLIHGTSFPIAYYEKTDDILHSVRKWPLDQGGQLFEQLEARIQEVLAERSAWGSASEGIKISKQTSPGIYELVDAQGAFAGRVTISVQTQGEDLLLCADVWKKETTFDGVKIDSPPLEDISLINSASTIDEIPFFGHQYWVSVHDFGDKIRSGHFIDQGEDGNQAIVATAGVKQGYYGANREETKHVDTETGTDSMDIQGRAASPTRQWILVYRWEGWWVWGDDDSDSYLDRALLPAQQVVVHVNPQTKRLLKIDRLEDVNKDGKRSPIVLGFILEPKRLLRIGLAEWVRHVQTVLDAISNQRLDSGLLVNAPWGFYNHAGGFDKKHILAIEPGKFLPIKDVKGVLMPKSNWVPMWSIAEENLVRQYGDAQAGLTGPGYGQQVSKRQSASEYAGVQSAIDLRTESIVEDLLLQIRKLFYRILGLYQQFGPRERMFRIMGDEGVEVTKSFELDRLSGKLLLKLTGNVDQLNESLNRQIALDMLQLLLNQILIETGVVQADTIHGAVELIAKTMHYTKVPIHKPDMPAMSDPPNVEHKQFASGQPVKGPTISENFNEHLQSHLKLMSDPKLSEMMPPEAQQKLGEHVKMTVQMQQQVQLLRQQMAQQTVALNQLMESKGVRPGKAGGQNPGDNVGPGTQDEIEGGAESQAA